MLTIRYQRTGKRNRPFYRVVLIDSRKSPQGKAKEILGFYDPLKKEKSLNAERITHWLSQGAQASVTAHNMFVREHIIDALKRKAHTSVKKEKESEGAGEVVSAKKEEAAPSEPKAKVKEETKEEAAPAEEKKPREEKAPEEIKQE